MADRELESPSERGSSASTNDRAANAAREAKDDVKDAAREAKDRTAEKTNEMASKAKAEAKAQGRELAHEGKERARSRAEEQKDRMSTGLRTVADALRRGGEDLDGDERQYGRILETVADRAEGASRYLSDRDVDSLTREVRTFARDHTPVFLSGAFTLGMLGARFLKSSPSDQSGRDSGTYPYGTMTGPADRSYPSTTRLEELDRLDARRSSGVAEGRLTTGPDARPTREGGYE